MLETITDATIRSAHRQGSAPLGAQGADEVDHTERDQPEADEERHGEDAANRMAYELHADLRSSRPSAERGRRDAESPFLALKAP